TRVKRALGYDDALDAFGVHGVGGFVGAILTGVFCYPVLGGHMDLEHGMLKQVGLQFFGVGVTIVYCGVVTFIILKVLDAVMGLRVGDEQERAGLDISEHEESGYNFT